MSVIEATLTNSVSSLVVPVLQVPLSEETLEGAYDVKTLDENLYTDFVATKRLWKMPWTILKEDDYNDLKAFYNYQFTNFEFPKLTINHYGDITDVSVRMYLNVKEVYNNCGDIQNIELTFRETEV